MKTLKKIEVVFIVLIVLSMLAYYNRYSLFMDETMVYRFKDQTESHCFIVYNDGSAEEMKEVSSFLYYNVPINKRIHVHRTSSDVSKRSLSYGFINVDTDKSIGVNSEFNENGIYFVKDTVLGKDEEESLGLFSFYIGGQMTEELEKRHFEIYDSILVEVRQ